MKYSDSLKIVLKHRIITIILAFALFASSLFIIPLLGFSFIPSTDQGEIVISASLDSGLTLDAASSKAKQMEALVKKHPEVKQIYTTVQKDNVNMVVMLTDKKDRKDNVKVILSKMRNEINSLSGIELAINSTSVGPQSSKDVSFIIKGDDNAQLQAFAYEAQGLLSKDPQVKDLGISSKVGKPEVKLEVDREKAIDLGVSPAMAAYTLSTLYSGEVVSKYDNGKDRIDIRVSMLDNQKEDIDSLKGIYVTGTNNSMVPLEQITKKVFKTSSATLSRYDRTGQIEVSANLSGISAGDFINKYTEKFKNEMKLPPGISVETGGMNQAMMEGMSSLVTALAMGILFIFLIMAAQFESYIDPIAIMFALPLAVIGAIFGLFIAGSEFSIMSMIGIIMLMGLVAKNAILLIDYAKQKNGRRHGKK